ncbi:protein PXR1-like [Melitaea cinxia]|uniref:protein PXR1-like n=1 Tax=Melitaea cinxia TaxID=113334 RepID=UPI001E271E4D|nr:protein PXR1-like [Melitaea cinxia]
MKYNGFRLNQVQLSPYNIEFGHVCEDPNNWEQRYEKKDFKNHRDMGKVRWGDKKGGYGEHYWDLNHAGHTDDNGDDDYNTSSDDGSYHEDPTSNDESNEKLQAYEIDEYNPDDISHYDENGRAKRANTRVKSKVQKNDRNSNEKEQLTNEYKQRNNKDDDKTSEESSEEYVTARPLRVKAKGRVRKPHEAEVSETKEKNDIVLIVNRKEQDDEEENYKPQQPKPLESYDNAEPKRFVSYEGGAGVRQKVQHEPLPSASVPRLFLDQSTGYIFDRTTGQAYVLQPIHQNIDYS